MKYKYTAKRNYEFGNMLTRKRESVGLTQEELGMLLKKPKAYAAKHVSWWETGVHCPNLRTFKEIVEVLGCTSDEVLEMLKALG